MSETILRLTPRDPLIARDGRPFGAGQGNRMRGLPWPLPSVVAGSFRTALVKARSDLDFTGDMPARLMRVEVAGVFPSERETLYLPAPADCVWDGVAGRVHAALPVDPGDGGCDLPAGLLPVMLTRDQSATDFKPKPAPAWWPITKLSDWLLGGSVAFDRAFLDAATQEMRDHVCLDADTGAAAKNQLFTTAGLDAAYLPRFGVAKCLSFRDRFAEVTLSARVSTRERGFDHVETLNTWHPLGGERRLVHWRRDEDAPSWRCPDAVRLALAGASHVRMVLATPAIFTPGWRPGWLDEALTGTPPGGGPKLKLVGVSGARWRAVSGWSLAKINDQGKLDPAGRPGPKAIRRMAPAGGVYFFEVVSGDAVALADRWLHPVSDAEQERNDGFGLAVWGTWNPNESTEERAHA